MSADNEHQPEKKGKEKNKKKKSLSIQKNSKSIEPK